MPQPNPQHKNSSKNTISHAAKYIYIIVGFISLVLGAAGAVLPILPTTPFLLLTAFCFARGSVGFHRWFCSTRLYQNHLSHYVAEKTLTIKTKITIVLFATSVMLLAYLNVKIIAVKIILLLLIGFHWWYFFGYIKTKQFEGESFMQNRMKTHALSEEKLESLLNRTHTGSLATINEDGTPYSTPVHFVYMNKCFYAHGLPKGQKIDNIIRNSKVGFSVFEMIDYILPKEGNDNPCNTNTRYESAIATGTATVIDDFDEKKAALTKVVEKYTPTLNASAIPDKMVAGTAVIKIEVSELTGKYYD